MSKDSSASNPQLNKNYASKEQRKSVSTKLHKVGDLQKGSDETNQDQKERGKVFHTKLIDNL